MITYAVDHEIGAVVRLRTREMTCSICKQRTMDHQDHNGNIWHPNCIDSGMVISPGEFEHADARPEDPISLALCVWTGCTTLPAAVGSAEKAGVRKMHMAAFVLASL